MAREKRKGKKEERKRRPHAEARRTQRGRRLNA